MIKITKTVLPDKTIVYTVIFKNKKEQEIIKKYIEDINGIIICTTYLEKYGYYEYEI